MVKRRSTHLPSVLGLLEISKAGIRFETIMQIRWVSLFILGVLSFLGCHWFC